MGNDETRRGNELLLPLNLTVESVQAVEFSLEKFKNTAAAKLWVRNHGLPLRKIRQLRDSIVAKVRNDSDFEDGTLRREKLNRDVELVVGELIESAASVRRAVPDADASNEEKREAQAERSEKWGIEALEDKGENLSYPAGGPESEGDYADPVNLKYPVETEERAANARARFKQNADVYSEEKSKAIVHERIVRAELAFGIEPSFDPDDPLDALLPAELKDELQEAEKRAPREVTKRGELHVLKAEEGSDPEAEVRMFGIVMKPEVPDVEGDVTSAEEIKQANDLFMREFGTMGFMHKRDVSEKVKIIQNVIAPIDFSFPVEGGEDKAISKGTWYQELFTDDPELVERIRTGKLNGLSIGGFARRVDPDEGEGEVAARKRAPEHLAKAEGDEPKARFVDLRVEEVSIVDAAANEEEFFIIKRRKDMAKEAKNQAAGGTQEPTSPNPPATPEPPAASTEPTPPTPTDKSAPPAPAPAEPAATPPTPPEPAPAPAAEPPQVDVAKAVSDAVSKMTETVSKAVGDAIEPLTKRLDAVEGQLKEQAVARAAAKGESVPDGTTVPAGAPAATESKWTGSAISGAVARSQLRR